MKKNRMKILLVVSGAAVFALSGCSSRYDEMHTRYGQQHSMFQQGSMGSEMDSEMGNSGRGQGRHGAMEDSQNPENTAKKRKKY